MRRLSLLLPLLCAVALSVRAHPYSKLPESIQLGDGFTSKKSSSSAASSSYSANKEENVEIEGARNGQGFGGSKSSSWSSSGGSHSESSSYSSASVSGSVPIGLIPGGGISAGQTQQIGYGTHPTKGFLTLQHGFNAAAGGGQNSGGQNGGASQYWWMGPNSPFETNKISGCTANGCVAGATFNTHIGLANPFLNGAAGFAAGHTLAGSGFSAGHTATGGGFSAGHTASASGYNAGQSAAENGFTAGQVATGNGLVDSGHSASGISSNTAHTAIGSGSNAGQSATESGYNTGHLAIGGGFGNSVNSIAGSASNAGQSATGHGFINSVNSAAGSASNAGQSESGYNAGHVATGNGFNSEHSTTGSGSNTAHTAIGSGFNAGHSSSGSGINAGHVATGSGFVNSGQSATESDYNAGHVATENGFVNSGHSATGSGSHTAHTTIGSGFNAGHSATGSGSHSATGSGSHSAHTTFGSGFNAGHSASGSGSHSATGSGSNTATAGLNSNAAASAFASANAAASANGGNTINLSKNPFFNGGAAGISTSSSGTIGFSAGSSGTNYGTAGVSSVDNTQTNLVGNGNPFFNGVSSNSGYEQQHVSQGQENNYVEQQFAGYPTNPLPKPISQSTEGVLKISCSGDNNICVTKSLCSADGYVFNKELTQVRTGPQFCNAQTEVCCTLRSQISDQTPAGTFVNANEQKHSTGGIFGNENGQQIESGHLFGNSNSGADSNGYLPPIGSEPSDNVPSFSNPPGEKDSTGGSNSPAPVAIFPPAAAPPPQIGCAAALICVEEQFCTLAGVISTQPQIFTTDDINRRVPLSTCQNPDNGIIGKCCRDPNYVDPWPAGNLPANYSGGFDEQGFPTILNIAKSRPNKKLPPIKTSFTAVKPAPIAPPTPTTFVKYPTQTPILVSQPTFTGGGVKSPAPVQIGVKTPPSYKKPTIQTSGPYPVSRPSPIPFPTDFQTPYVKNNYDTSSSNQNPIIAPHVPGSQCGRRNTVQRPNSLTDVDVAFGEITWQAMVADHVNKKLLCSGAIIAPNAVITAARCVEGYRASDISIKSGEWKLGYDLKHEEPLPFEIINVASIAPYPRYSTGNPGNDVAILFLEHDMKLDQHVDVLCLPEGQPRPPRPGSKCIATGWGKTVLQVNLAGALMHSLDVDIIDNEQCAQRVAGAETIIGLDDSLICAKAHRKSNNMCQVDFGGPLACDRGDGFYELTGIYNQDTGCIPTNQVATFTMTPTPWVKDMMTKVPQYSKTFENPTNVGQIIHNHGPNEPCDCQRSEYPAASNQYLPPS